MSQPGISLVPTEEFLQCLIALENNSAFVKFMKILEKRAQNIAIWGHFLPEELHRLWVGGRVLELSELLIAWENRRELKDQNEREVPSGAADGVY